MLSLVKFSNKIDKKTTQKQPEMTVSTGTKTFENLKLQNCRYDIAKILKPFIYWKLRVPIKGREFMLGIYQDLHFNIT